jgi:hypothetical protein
MALAPHDFTALAPHDYTAPAPHDCTAPAPPPRARYANDSEFKFGPGYPKIAKFLVPVDGSQQNFVRSSPAGTHRTFFWIHFQNPVSPTSISQNAAARAQHFILGYELCFSMSTLFGLALLLFSYGFPLWKPEIQDASPADPPSGTSIQSDFCEDDTIIRYHSFDRSS